jgi:hypothetical protein
MKYLKMFQSSDEYYWRINNGQFTDLVYGGFENINQEERKRWIEDNWSKEEKVNRIEDILTKKYSQFTLEFKVDGSSVSMFPKVNRERPSVMVPFFVIRVYCLRDEWYCVTVTGCRSGSGNLFFQCDQLDGLRKCIRELNP